MEKQTFQIPDGCKAITMEQIGNQLVTTFEVESKFKDGDVVISNDKDVLIIFKEYTNEDTIESHFNSANADNYGWLTLAFRLATPEEAQRLWDALAKQGKRWNPETKQVEPLRWRAEFGKCYCCLYGDMSIVTTIEYGVDTDNMRYNSGNYFRTEEQAERAKPYLQKALDDFWKEELE